MIATFVAAPTGKPEEKLDKVALSSTSSADCRGSRRIQRSKHSIESNDCASG